MLEYFEIARNFEHCYLNVFENRKFSDYSNLSTFENAAFEYFNSNGASNSRKEAKLKSTNLGGLFV